jgi:hypothetical protein
MSFLSIHFVFIRLFTFLFPNIVPVFFPWEENKIILPVDSCLPFFLAIRWNDGLNRQPTQLKLHLSDILLNSLVLAGFSAPGSNAG